MDHYNSQRLNCNLQLKVTSRKRKGQHDDDDDEKKKKKNREYEDDDDDDGDNSKNYYLPVVFHNLKCYDSHFVIKHFRKQYTERARGGSPTYGDVEVIPLNSEKYMMFQLGNLRFVDSFQFMSTSLENLVSLLLKSGRENFPNTTRYLADDDLVFAKGVYPYSYVTSREKFEDTQLPPIEAFHNTLTDEPLDVKDYERAQATWKRFGMKTPVSYTHLTLPTKRIV